MMDEFQTAAAEFVAADTEYERLMRIKPMPVEAWDASEACYRAHKKLWLLFGGAPCNVRTNTMFNQYYPSRLFGGVRSNRTAPPS